MLQPGGPDTVHCNLVPGGAGVVACNPRAPRVTGKYKLHSMRLISSRSTAKLIARKWWPRPCACYNCEPTDTGRWICFAAWVTSACRWRGVVRGSPVLKPTMRDADAGACLGATANAIGNTEYHCADLIPARYGSILCGCSQRYDQVFCSIHRAPERRKWRR